MDQDQQQLRNLRDFLLVYNRMTETCFQRCTSNFNYRNLTMNESQLCYIRVEVKFHRIKDLREQGREHLANMERCVDSCAGKLIRSNHRLMGTYVQLIPGIVQRRMEEMEAKAGEMGQSAEAGTSIGTVPAAMSTLADGTVAESMTVLAPTSAGLAEEIPLVIAPPSDGVTVDIPPILAPTTGEAAADITPVIAQSTSEVSNIASVIALPTGGPMADIIPATAPPGNGVAVDSLSVLASPSAEVAANIAQVNAPPSSGGLVGIAPGLMPPPVDSTSALAPPTAMEPVGFPQIQSPTSVGTAVEPASVAVPASSAGPPLSETLRSLPDLAAPPPIPPLEALPPPLPVNPSSSTSNG